jgi:ubiquinone/menaquinone biosynthesis C-methylase UbiE
MSDYLKIKYNKNDRPYTDYPRRLISYLFTHFEMKKGTKLLEPGFGRGEHLRIFRDLGLEVYGMDISPEAPDLANDLDISVCNLDNEKLPYSDNFFDVVYSKSFLEHLRDPSFF